MTVVPLRPQVDLTFSDISAEALHHVDQSHLGTPEEVIRGALMSYRLLVINHVKMEIANTTRLNTKKLLQLIDTAGQLYLGRFNRLVGPAAAASYLRAYKAAGAGDVPMSTIYALAEQHAARMGEYFNETSKEALVQGFNTFVNQRVPVRVAADRALDAFGLTPRQMSGYTSTRVAGKVSSAQEIPWRGKVTDYINRSLHDRFQVFATQEAHNLDQQAQQTAWMWLQNKGAISEVAEKVWITARDERVCPECGPMHGKRVPVTARFKMPSGGQLYVPGAHPRCRCEARLVDPVQLVRKDLRGGELEHFNREHPRDESGRFSAKARAQATLQERARNRSTIFREVGFGDRPSPGLEQMVAEAERLRESTPVIEEAPPTYSMKPAALSMSTGLSMKKPLQMKGSLSMVGADEQTYTMSGQQKANARMADAAPYAMPAAQKQRMMADTRAIFNEIVGKPTPRKRRTFREQTIELDVPVYAVVSYSDTDRARAIELTTDTKFAPDEAVAAGQASEDFQAAIEDAIDDITYNKNGMISMQTREGDDLEAELPLETIHDLVHTVAYQHGSNDNDEWRGMNVTQLVTWRNKRTGEAVFSEKLTYEELAKILKLKPEQFEVYVLRLTRGHDSRLGQTHQDSWGTKGAYTTYVTTGQYHMEPDYRIQVGMSAPVYVFNLEPDAEFEDITDE